MFASVLAAAAPVSIAQTMASAPPDRVETGTPSFVVLGAEAMGLSTQPADLQVLPDGRILATSLREITLGDGLRWEVFRGADGEESIAPQVAVDEQGNIYTGVRGGIARVELGSDARWRLARAADLPADSGLQKITLAWVTRLENQWYWYGGSGSVVAWRPGETARVVANADAAIERVFSLGSDVFLSDRSIGSLFRLRRNASSLERVSRRDVMASQGITCAAPLNANTLLVGTGADGLRTFDGTTTQPFGHSRLLGPGFRLTDLCVVGDGVFAAAVDTVGIVFFDRSGKIVQVLDRSLDHRLSRVKRLVHSRDGVLWALLNEGVARVQFPSPISHFEPLIPSGLVYAKPLRHEGSLWLLADGRALRAAYDADGRIERFEEDSPPGRFLFTLAEVQGHLLAGNENGIYMRTASGWTSIVTGVVNARMVGRPTEAGIPFAARGEVGWLQRTPEGFRAERRPFPELPDNYGSAQDAAGVVWLELGTNRVARFDPNPAQPTVEVFGAQDGLADGWVEVYALAGEARFHLANHFLLFDPASRRFVEDRKLLARFPADARPEGRVARAPDGRLWYTANGQVHILERRANGAAPRITTLAVGFSPLEYTIDDAGVVWIFNKQRLSRIDPRVDVPAAPPLQARLTSVEFSSSGRWVFSPAGALPPVDYGDNSLMFHFAAPANPFAAAVGFEVLLEGAGSQWVSTGTIGSASFNRLKEGDYVFRVRPVAGGTLRGDEARLAFTIRPPWFRTRLAWVAYVLTAVGLVSFAGWLSSYLQRRENDRLEQLVGERTQALRASEERYRTLNTELEQRVEARTAELSHSNRELQQRESLFRLIFEQAPVGISWRRSDLGTAYHFNAAFRRILGLSDDTTIDYALLTNLVHPADAERQASLDRLIESGEADSYNLEERFVLADGRTVWGSFSVAVIRDDAGRAVQEIGILEDITPRKQAEEQLAATYKRLVATSRVAGMAEVATGVLHNVGNVLNSLNVSANVIADTVRHSKTDLLQKLSALLHEHAANLPHFLTADPKGRRVPEMVAMLAENAAGERAWLIEEIAAMQRSIDHIKEIVVTQQDHATMAGVVETLDASSLCEDALRINDTFLPGRGVNIVRDYRPVPPITVEKGKVLQILVNLVRNAKEACEEAGDSPGGRTITVRVEPGAPGCVRFVVEDNGVGIAPANLSRIFTHGFTTRPHGHGFGLHASILAALEMHGTLRVESAGTGHGAAFFLELPIAPPDPLDGSGPRAAFPSPIQPRTTPLPR